MIVVIGFALIMGIALVLVIGNALGGPVCRPTPERQTAAVCTPSRNCLITGSDGSGSVYEMYDDRDTPSVDRYAIREDPYHYQERSTQPRGLDPRVEQMAWDLATRRGSTDGWDPRSHSDRNQSDMLSGRRWQNEGQARREDERFEINYGRDRHGHGRDEAGDETRWETDYNQRSDGRDDDGNSRHQQIRIRRDK